MAKSKEKKGKFFYGSWIVTSLFITNFAVEATAIFSFAVFLKPMSEDLNISRGAISWVVAARRLATGFVSIFIGRLIDKYGSRMLIMGSASLAGISVILMGWVENIWQFLLLFLLIGLSGITMPGNLLTSVPVQKWFVRKRGRATSFAAGGFGVGGMTFVLVHQQIIDIFSWRIAWIASGIFVLVVILPVTWILIRRQPEDMGLLPDGENPTNQADESQLGDSTDEISWTGRAALKTTTLWQVLLAYLCISFAMGGVQVHRVAFWEDRGYDRSLIASSFSLDAFMFFGGILSAGFLVEKMPVRFVGSYAMFITVLALLVTVLIDAKWVMFFSAIAFGIGQGTNAVVQVHIWPTYFGRRHIGAIRGYIVPGIVAAQALGAPFTGFVFDSVGSYGPAYWAAIGLALTAAILLFIVTTPKVQTPASI